MYSGIDPSEMERKAVYPDEVPAELENEVPHNTYIPGSLAKIAVVGSIAAGFALIVWSTF